MGANKVPNNSTERGGVSEFREGPFLPFDFDVKVLLPNPLSRQALVVGRETKEVRSEDEKAYSVEWLLLIFVYFHTTMRKARKKEAWGEFTSNADISTLSFAVLVNEYGVRARVRVRVRVRVRWMIKDANTEAFLWEVNTLLPIDACGLAYACGTAAPPGKEDISYERI